MSATILRAPERRWECPNCDRTHVDKRADAKVPYHPCPGLRGLSAPFVAAGTRAKVATVAREDYTNGDRVQLDGDGRAVMAIVTTTDDRQDCAVLAPAASGRSG